ncbi:MAG: class I SAM-dependent methyltransferase [Planctomycetes bacterium]|nr:class I SAM-dependent methyltransferase [Planctomycetota bacterium]
MKATVHEVYRSETDHWWFAARRSIFARVLDVWTKGKRVRRVLDLGPGFGVNAPVLAPRGHWIPLDVAAPSLNGCRASGPALPVRADATQPPFRSGSLDLICALDVLEHLDDDAGALRAWRDAIAQDGTLLLSVPAFQVLWGRQDVLSEHRRRYRAPQLRARLEAAGFTVRHLTYFNSVLFLPILAVRLAMRPFLARSVAAGGSDLSMPMPIVGGLLRALLAAERFWIARHRLPFGVSLLAVATPTPPTETPR